LHTRHIFSGKCCFFIRNEQNIGGDVEACIQIGIWVLEIKKEAA